MHRIFSNLRGFIIFEFTTSGNGWEDDFSSGGDKECSYFFNFPGDGLGCGDLDGDFGNGHGSNFNYKSKKMYFVLMMKHDAQYLF
jgi:hypothetical protein